MNSSTRLRASGTHSSTLGPKRVLQAIFAVVASGVLAAPLVGFLLASNLLSPPLSDFMQARAQYKIFGPEGAFDPTQAPPAPDYAEDGAWAALPTRLDGADVVPATVKPGATQASAPVDVFYLHPTTMYRGPQWNAPIDPQHLADDQVQWMIANQASAFNACCRVYAPHYRDATIFAYFPMNDQSGLNAMNFAYADVAKAFDYYIEHYNAGRPFILAGHSQGARHGEQLLRERIGDSPLADRMVAAYLVGAGLFRSTLDSIPGVHICASRTDVNCVMHWATFADSGIRNERWYESQEREQLCTNPLTWKVDGQQAPKESHRGAVRPVGRLDTGLWGRLKSRDPTVPAPDAPIPNLTGARCEGGVLLVESLTDPAFTSVAENGERKSFHNIDYSLFYMDIRENALERTRAFLTLDRDCC